MLLMLFKNVYGSRVMGNIGFSNDSPITLIMDNQSTICLVNNPMYYKTWTMVQPIDLGVTVQTAQFEV